VTSGEQQARRSYWRVTKSREKQRVGNKKWGGMTSRVQQTGSCDRQKTANKEEQWVGSSK